MEDRFKIAFLQGEELKRESLLAVLDEATLGNPPEEFAETLLRMFTALVNVRLPEGYVLAAPYGALVGPADGEWEPTMPELSALLEEVFTDFCSLMPGSAS